MNGLMVGNYRSWRGWMIEETLLKRAIEAEVCERYLGERQSAGGLREGINGQRNQHGDKGIGVSGE